MVTQNQTDAWLGEQVGQHLDYDQQYGQQCFDFFNYYYQFVTGDGPYADGYGVEGAKDIWDIPTDFFDKIPDSNNLTPNVGDVLIYGPSWGGGFGHVEVCRWSDDGGCHVIGENEHNNSNEGVVEVYRSWASMRGLIGVMRPRLASEPVPDPQPTPEVSNEPTLPQPEAPAPVPDPSPLPEPVVPPVPGTVITPEPAPVNTPDPIPVLEAPAPASTPVTPAKVVVDPTYYKIWELIVAIFKKLIGRK